MYSGVYRLRERGIRLSKPLPPVYGELRIRPHRIGTRDPHAVLAELLLDADAPALPPLHQALVRKLTRGGIVIMGVEMISRQSAKSRVERYLQTWWCMVLPEPVAHNDVQSVAEQSASWGRRMG